jgi:hypothetical protein
MNATIASAVPDPIIERLEDQIRWYDVRSRSKMRRYKQPKISEDYFALGDSSAASGIPRAVIVTGVLGILVTR